MSDGVQPYPRTMGHIGLVVSNINEGFERYQDVLGLTPVMVPDTVESGVQVPRVETV
jgi:catechol-2,3-dioxygenase